MKLKEFLELDIIEEDDKKSIWLDVRNDKDECEFNIDLNDILYKGFSREDANKLKADTYKMILEKYGDRNIISVQPACSMTMDAMFLIIVK